MLVYIYVENELMKFREEIKKKKDIVSFGL